MGLIAMASHEQPLHLTNFTLTRSVVPFLLCAAVPILAVFLYFKLRYHRFKQYASLPQRPPSLLLGNMGEVQEWATSGEPDRHPGKSSFVRLRDYLANIF